MPERPRPPSSPPPGADKQPGGDDPRSSWKGWGLLLVLLVMMIGYQLLGSVERAQPEVPYTRFYALVEKGDVDKVLIRGTEVTGSLKREVAVGNRSVKSFRTQLPLQEDEQLLPMLREQNVSVSVEDPEQNIWMHLWTLLPIALLVGVWIWMSRRAQRMMGGPGGPFGNIIKNRTRKFDKETDVTVTFSDVAGATAAKRDLREIVQFLKEPERFQRLGGKVPRGVLLVGPPGTGKTLLARAVAGEAGVPFFSINGSEFIELFVGVGASRVRELFEEAKKVAPAIVFIDEIDAVGRSRGAGLGGGHDEREQTLNQLLSEMDGFNRNETVVVVAATNRPDVLDPALQRPGRFDRRVVVDRPELDARQAILRVHTKDKPIAPDVDLKAVARVTPGFSGADLANLANEAALHATRRGADAIEKKDFEAAFDKIVLGDLRETRLTPDEKKRVAVHEAGHTIVSHLSERGNKPQRVSIIPRGMALGVTQQSPSDDRHLMTQRDLEAMLRMLMGGYAAERVVLDEISSGAADDLRRATEIAHKMVAQFGMSERIGPVYHEHRTEHPFLGKTVATDSGTSDSTVHLIEEEARLILEAARDQALQVIRDNRQKFDALVDLLLEKETVDKKQLRAILGAPVGGDDSLTLSDDDSSEDADQPPPDDGGGPSSDGPSSDGPSSDGPSSGASDEGISSSSEAAQTKRWD